MPEVDIPVVPLAQAPLSESILSYLRQISDNTGRYICFWDARDIRKVDPSFPLHVKARAIAEPNKPFLAIVVDMGDLSRAGYAPPKHDPLIAHEATHLVLWTDGYRLLEYSGQPESARWALDATSNWLADPIINRRIQQLGFDMAPDRMREIKQSSVALNKGTWRHNAPETAIRLAVSFILEPGIPPEVTRTFRQAVNRGLAPAHSRAVFQRVEAIGQEGITSPQLHDAAVGRCFDTLNRTLGLSLGPPSFAPQYERFSPRHMSRWESDQVKTTKAWP